MLYENNISEELNLLAIKIKGFRNGVKEYDSMNEYPEFSIHLEQIYYC